MLQLPANSNTSNPTYLSAAGSSQPIYGLKSFSAGYNFGVALSNTGEVWAFGGNGDGQLGQGTKSSLQGAVRVKKDASGAPLTGQVMAVAGGLHAMSMDKDGTVWSWGRNVSGQLGDGPNAPRWSDSPLPAPVVSETGLGRLASIATAHRNLHKHTHS